MTMQAFELRSYDGPDGLHHAEVAVPEPGPDEALVRVRAIGVNMPDLLLTQGRYQRKPELPVVPGCELAGEVEVASDGSGWQTGDRVAAFVWEGAFAERAVVPTRSLLRLPVGTEVAEGAAVAVNAHTSLFALQRRGRLRAGETVLVLGGAGGVGTASIQVARGLGARVLAVVSRPERVEAAREAGAEEVMVASDTLSRQVRERTDGRGVDVVVDPVGGPLFDEALRSLAPEGRLIVVGFATGDIPKVGVNRLLLRNVDVIGAAYGNFADLEPDLVAEQQRTLSQLLTSGAYVPRIARHFRFAELPDALRELERGRIPGKAVIHGPEAR